MNLNVLFVTVIFIFSCNGDDVQRDLTSSNLLNVGGYAAAAKSILSPVNTLNQPSVAPQGLNSIASIIAKGGNYIIDASSLGGGFLIGQNGNLMPATVPNQPSSTFVNEKPEFHLPKHIYQGLQLRNVETVTTPSPFLKTVLSPLSDTETEKQLIPSKPQLSLSDIIRNLGGATSQPLFATNPAIQLSQIPTNPFISFPGTTQLAPVNNPPINPLPSLSGITKLAPVYNPSQQGPVSFVRTILIQLPSYNPLAIPRPYVIRTPPTKRLSDSILRIRKTVPVNDDDDFQ